MSLELNVFGVPKLLRIRVEQGDLIEGWTCVYFYEERFFFWKLQRSKLCSSENQVIYSYPDVESTNNYYCQKCFEKVLRPQLLRKGLMW